MAKKKGISVVKLILTGILWGTIYFGAIIPVIGWFLDFNFLSAHDWSERYRLFVEYKWRIHTGMDYTLLFMMIAWIPLFFVGWWRTYNVKWNKLKPGPRKKKVVKKVFELNENRPLYHMPRKMPSAVQARRYVAPKLPNQTEEVVSGTKSHTNLVQMIRLIATLAKKYKVEIFQHILLEGNRVPMAISTDARAVLIEIVNKKNVNWSVEFTDDVTQGSWYSEGGIMDKLAQDLIRASASLAKSEPNSEILSAIVVTDGRILNTKQAVEYFRSKGIFLIGYNNAEPKAELPDLASFLSAYFDLKDGETDPAPQPVEKVPLRTKHAQQDTSETDDVIEEDVTIEDSKDDEYLSTSEDEISETDAAQEAEETIENEPEDDFLIDDTDDTDDETLPEEEDTFKNEEPVKEEPHITASTQLRKIRAPLPSQSQGGPKPTPAPNAD